MLSTKLLVTTVKIQVPNSGTLFQSNPTKMASNDTNSITLGAKQGPRDAQDLDTIANFMDEMLNNMKQNITKSGWNELYNSTFNSLDVTKNSSYNSHKQVLETIYEDEIYNPVPPAETSKQTVRKESTDVALITEIPVSETPVNNSPKTSVKSNINKQQSIKISKEKSKNSPSSKNKKSSKNNSAPVKKDTQMVTVVNDLTRPKTQPWYSQRTSVGIKKPISQNTSRTTPSTNKTIETIMAPVPMDKINELNSIKKNKTNTSLRPALSKIKLQMENKNKDSQKTKSNITQPNPKTISAPQNVKPAFKAQSMDSKQVTFNKVPNSKQIKNVKNVIVKQIQNGKIREPNKVKPQNVGDNKTARKFTNNPASVNTKPQSTNKGMDNSKTKENNSKPTTANTSNGTNSTVRNIAEPVVPTTLVSNQTQTKPTVHSKLVIKTSDLTMQSLYQNTAINNLIVQCMTSVNQAKREHKTYTIVGGFYPLRQAFAERGWIEKVRVLMSGDRDNWKKMESLSNVELAEGILTNKGPKYRRALLSKLLLGHQVDFYWDYTTNPFTVNNDKVKRTLINRFPPGANRCYCSKAGLCNIMKDSQWYHIEGYANVLAPRTYNLGHDDEIQEFIHDFRMTAAISLMKWIDEHAMDSSKIVSDQGTIPMSIFNFAVLQIANFIREKEHRDIDERIEAAPSSEWDLFLEKYYAIIQEDKQFIESGKLKPPYMIRQARYLLHELRRYLPVDMTLDGMMNMWLLKPHLGSRGCGIQVCRTLKYILDTVQARKDRKYVVQKYIERPLLIYNTKFDIRQWFLVTCMPYVKVWMYKECYLRFSSQMFDLKKLNESIHLTNNSVQCKYKNCCERDANLPPENMWHSTTFEQYLSDMGYPFAWKNNIYRGMKEALVALYMTCQDKMATRINSFELCGADFMVSEDFKPYLIEINSRPAIYASTKITAVMCPKVLTDVIKVTIDHARNPKASTGNFELIYSDSLSYAVPRTIIDIDTFRVEGKSYYSTQVTNKNTESTNNSSNNVLDRVKRKSDMIEKILNIDATKVKKDAKGTLEKILEVIHSEQTKSNERRNRTMKARNMLSEYVDIISNNNEEDESNDNDNL